MDILDAIFARNRQRMAIKMSEEGQLDPESAVELFAAQTKPDVVAEDREALEKGSFDPGSSPSGRLGTLLFKLPRKKK